MPVKRTVNQGHDRLTRIADRALQFIEADPDYRPADRVIIAMDDGSGVAGLGMSGYQPPGGEDLAALDLTRHVRALNRVGRPQLTTPKAELPAALQRPGGPGWLSRNDAKP
jgi:hypothetical protein